MAKKIYHPKADSFFHLGSNLQLEVSNFSKTSSIYFTIIIYSKVQRLIEWTNEQFCGDLIVYPQIY